MSQEHKHEQVRSRNEPFVSRTATRIWQEIPSSDNPYIAAAARCHGYDVVELMAKCSVVDVFYLLFRGELPTPADAQLLQQLMIALLNPGPRHPATRAAMNAGIGKTDPVHILPIAAAVLGGDYMGSGEVEGAMQFFAENQHTAVIDVSIMLAQEFSVRSEAQQQLSKTGFGIRNGGIEIMAVTIAKQLVTLAGAGSALQWGCQLNEQLQSQGMGWLITGVAAAVLLDMGFSPRTGAALFQLLGAPGLLAHGIEMSSKPILAMPFVSDEHYAIQR